MPFGYLKRVVADVQLSDKEYVKNEKGRHLPWSVSPFREPRTTASDGSSKEEEEEPPSEWFELAGDLAWTTTFSTLTSSTQVTDSISVGSYAAFFFLAWHLWATQTIYDVKYYTNDWFHRILFVCQLGVYASLAAFSGSFNVGWEINSDTMNIFTGNVTALTAEAITTDEENSMIQSFRGVNFILSISRILLLIQYLRVLKHHPKRKQPWKKQWRFWLVPIATGVAGLIFLICGITMEAIPRTKPAVIAQLPLWGLAIALQVAATIATPEEGEKVLKNQSPLSNRLSNLTVIILGEGLNGICGTLRHSITSLGLSTTMGFEAFAVLLTLFFVWLLYFDGFRIKSSSGRKREKTWLWLHFFLHLALIMLLEFIKNFFLFLNVVNATKLLNTALSEIWDYAAKHDYNWPPHPRLEKLLLPLKISWDQEVKDLDDTIDKSPDTDTAGQAAQAQFLRWLAEVQDKLFGLYNDEPDKEAEDLYKKYISNNDTVIVNDDGTLFSQSSNRYLEVMEFSGQWLIIAGGVLLFVMAILNTIQRGPKNRFAWSYSLGRGVIGIILIAIGIPIQLTGKVDKPKWIGWIIPTVTIGYAIAAAIDLGVHYLSIRSIRKKEVDSENQAAHGNEEKGSYDTGRGPKLAQLSELSYDKASS
ncbi:hypothetical protein FRC04_005690 [Tulasnella sp. 424]|nr:hypothetical protein FRC04_005690 [Tulasnella sp. 424]KAG8962065.1 hypothetical protein FRC05_005534 [Tulasnella sp. 425]